MLKEIDKGFLIGRWWTHYIRYWDADLAETKRIIDTGDKWLEVVLKKMRGGQRHLPPYIFVEEDSRLTKAYLAHVSGRCGYKYVTATKCYFCQSDEGDIHIDEDDIDIRDSTLYPINELELLLEQNFLYRARIYDTWFHENNGNEEMMRRHFAAMQYHKKRAEKINTKLLKCLIRQKSPIGD